MLLHTRQGHVADLPAISFGYLPVPSGRNGGHGSLRTVSVAAGQSICYRLSSPAGRISGLLSVRQRDIVTVRCRRPTLLVYDNRARSALREAHPVTGLTPWCPRYTFSHRPGRNQPSSILQAISPSSLAGYRQSGDTLSTVMAS